MQWCRYLLLVAAGFAGTPATPAYAAAKSCQEALATSAETEPDIANPDSEFGLDLFDINGDALRTPMEFQAAIAQTTGKTPLIKGGDFSRWNFAAQGFTISHLCFYQSKLAASKWDGGHFPGIGFVEADLAGASFRSADLGGLLLRESFLTDADMSGARLDGGLLDGGWGGGLSKWNLSGASLRGFKFQCGLTISDGCPLDRSGVKFVNADFSDADISTYPFWGQADYSGAILSNTRLSPRHLTDIKAANAKGAIILTGGGEATVLLADEFSELQRQAHEAIRLEKGPSFSCKKAVSAVERMICAENDMGLRSWDRILASIYADVKAHDPAIVADQRKWLASRSRCKDGLCLSKLYGARVELLLRRLGEPELLARRESALFIDQPVAFPDAFRSTDLYRRIIPVLIDASLGEAIVERSADGSYTIFGESIAANAHSCSVSGSGLRYDRATGWFAAFDAKGGQKPAAVFRAYRNQIEFPGVGHPTDEDFPGSDEFASCGMRASLMPMHRIEASAELLEKREAILSQGY